MFKILIGAAIGAAAAWFLDPNDGPRRRNIARDKATQAGATIKGKATAAAPATGPEPAGERVSDQALRDKVETSA
jgi:gas vesicle protein